MLLLFLWSLSVNLIFGCIQLSRRRHVKVSSVAPELSHFPLKLSCCCYTVHGKPPGSCFFFRSILRIIPCKFFFHIAPMLFCFQLFKVLEQVLSSSPIPIFIYFKNKRTISYNLVQSCTILYNLVQSDKTKDKNLVLFHLNHKVCLYKEYIIDRS